MRALAEQHGGGWQGVWDRGSEGFLLRQGAWMQTNERRLFAATE